MKDNILYSFIYLLASLLLVPPLFIEGSIFDVPYSYVNEYGVKVIEHGIYFDNVFITILTIIGAWVSACVPLLASKTPKLLMYLSFMISAWYLGGLVYEISNFKVPHLVLNDKSNTVLFNRALIMFIIGLTLISIHTRWKKQQQL